MTSLYIWLYVHVYVVSSWLQLSFCNYLTWYQSLQNVNYVKINYISIYEKVISIKTILFKNPFRIPAYNYI